MNQPPARTRAGSSSRGLREQGTKPPSEAKQSERREPCRFIMERLQAEFGLEFIYARLSERGRFKVMDYAQLMLEWEEAGPKKVREIDRLRARKVPALLSQKYPPA